MKIYHPFYASSLSDQRKIASVLREKRRRKRSMEYWDRQLKQFFAEQAIPDSAKPEEK